MKVEFTKTDGDVGLDVAVMVDGRLAGTLTKPEDCREWFLTADHAALNDADLGTRLADAKREVKRMVAAWGGTTRTRVADVPPDLRDLPEFRSDIDMGCSGY